MESCSQKPSHMVGEINKKYNISGYFHSELFRPLIDAFIELHENGNDVQSQLCIYVGDTKYIDIFSTQ